MIKNSIKKVIIFPIVMLLTLTILSSLFLFIPKKQNPQLEKSLAISKLIEKYDAGKMVTKTIDNEYLTEEADRKISINDFCTFTNTKYNEDEDFIKLTYNDFSLSINKANNYLVAKDGTVVLLDDNNLYPLETLATNLGFEISVAQQTTKLTRPYQTKRVIVEANGEFDPVGAIEVLNWRYR